eukprot:COSAG03_NODE_21383_length_304_cov_4.531707_1_plen_69_part_10
MQPSWPLRSAATNSCSSSGRRTLKLPANQCHTERREKTDARGEIRGAREETRDETRSNSAEREERSEKR